MVLEICQPHTCIRWTPLSYPVIVFIRGIQKDFNLVTIIPIVIFTGRDVHLTMQPILIAGFDAHLAG